MLPEANKDKKILYPSAKRELGHGRPAGKSVDTITKLPYGGRIAISGVPEHHYQADEGRWIFGRTDTDDNIFTQATRSRQLRCGEPQPQSVYPVKPYACRPAGVIIRLTGGN